MYVYKHNMLNYNDNNFVIPSYFASWVSGFIEAEGHFSAYANILTSRTEYASS